jgi:hypothetical protein
MIRDKVLAFSYALRLAAPAGSHSARMASKRRVYKRWTSHSNGVTSSSIEIYRNDALIRHQHE